MKQLFPLKFRVQYLPWVLFFLLCFIWGSSFFLMKISLYAQPSQTPLLNAWQVASLRMFSAAIIFAPIGYKAVRELSRHQLGWVALSGFIGSFIPAFLFCIAETKISSALAGSLNAVTPIFTIIISLFVYKNITKANQWIGILIGFSGCLLLFFNKHIGQEVHLMYSLLVVLATILYAFNVNMVKEKLQNISAYSLTAAAMFFLLIPSGLALWFSGIATVDFTQPPYQKALASAVILGVIGTAIATVIFYQMVKLSGPMFASLVTYGIPIVAILWGYFLNEPIGPTHLIALIIILVGVYIANKKTSKKKQVAAI